MPRFELPPARKVPVVYHHFLLEGVRLRLRTCWAALTLSVWLNEIVIRSFRSTVDPSGEIGSIGDPGKLPREVKRPRDGNR